MCEMNKRQFPIVTRDRLLKMAASDLSNLFGLC